MSHSLKSIFVTVCFLGVEGLFGDKLQLFGVVSFYSPVKAGLVADVTLAGINGDLENQAVLVAVNKYLLDLLNMAGLLTLGPQLLARPAVICCQARFDSLFKRLLVHISDHQDFVSLCILGYSCNQPIGVESRCEIITFFNYLFV